MARLSGFLDIERATLQTFSLRRGEEANIVFLTPGFRHPSFFEHAYKARLLGFPLVEAADLTVRERRLFLKTLAGLRKIDGVVCRIDDHRIDPLEHWGTEGEGVPGMVEAWRTGNVALANAPGSGFACKSRADAVSAEDLPPLVRRGYDLALRGNLVAGSGGCETAGAWISSTASS